MLLTGARDSPLSRAQFEELQTLISVPLTPYFIQTKGDLDKATSLRTMDKTNFFTKELDELLLEGKIRLALHSAKDLPDPIPEGLEVIAITAGLDSRDALVLGDKGLFPGARIGLSSERREKALLQLSSDVEFKDIRGTIEERLALLSSGIVDGVVIAEAALIRLKLTHLKRIYLPGETAPLQGKLAVVARKNDVEMRALFRS